MALSIARAIPGAPPDLAERIEAAHARLHRTRCQEWLAATGNRPTSPYTANRRAPVMFDGETGPVPVSKTAQPVRGASCEHHPVEGAP